MSTSKRKIRKVQVAATVVKKVEFRPSKNKHSSNLDVQVKSKKQHSIPIPTVPRERQKEPPPRQADDDNFQSFIDDAIAMEQSEYDKGEDLPPTRSKTQSHYLSAWLPHRAEYLSCMFDESAPPSLLRCEKCSRSTASVWRCLDCSTGTQFCSTCCASAHARSPLHRVQKWTGAFWRPTPLWQLGVRLHLGHSCEGCHAAGGADSIGPEYELEDLGADDFLDDDEQVEHDDDDGNDDEQDEMFERFPEIHVGGFPAAPRSVGAGGPKFLVVVHTNGIHRLPYIPCNCSDTSEESLFLQQQLYPATQIDIRTVFTFELLRLFHLLNLVCKVTAYSFYRFLRRLTCPALPSSVPDRERELRRVMRMWRNLVSYQRSGFGHKASKPGRGDLAIFCATCPQPGINLDPDYLEDQDHPSIIRVLAADGNEKADHIRYRSSFPDVALTNGEGYMTEAEPYQKFLARAEARSGRFEQKPTCHKYNVTKHANRRHANIDITGIAAHACARHACFAPSSVVDFKRGERQMNIDYSLSQALQTTNMEDVEDLFIIYDLMCQYQVHLQDRFQDGWPDLKWPPDMKTLVTAIGKFHVHAHQESCLFRFSPGYIPEAAQVDGEAMEPNWAGLNSTSQSVRSASLEHRTEVLDDHMFDSNFGKLINAAHSTAQRLKRATTSLEVAREEFDAIKEACSEPQIAQWNKQIEKAEESRRKGLVLKMDVMRSTVTKGKSRQEIELDMTEAEIAEGALGETTWLALGIEIEELQRMIITMVRKPHQLTTTSRQLTLQQRRQRVLRLIERFNEGAELHMDDELDKIPIDEDALPEHIQIPYPSLIPVTPNDQSTDSLLRLRQKERRLREGQANDTLQRLREHISQLSFQFIGKVRNANSTYDKTRSWRAVTNVVEDIRSLRVVYNTCRDRLISLSSANHVRDQGYWELTEDDCSMSPAIYNPNARGLGDSGLSWLWSTVGADQPDGAGTAVDSDDVHLTEFYRLHYLRARAKMHRWQEELILNKYELKWTTLYFVYQAKQWRTLRDQPSNTPGQKAYAAERISMWNSLGQAAEAIAVKANPGHIRIWQLIE